MLELYLSSSLYLNRPIYNPIVYKEEESKICVVVEEVKPEKPRYDFSVNRFSGKETKTTKIVCY